MFDWIHKLRRPHPSSASKPEDLFPEERQEFYNDPYRYYEVLRRDHPFYRNAGGAWVISRHGDVKAALEHPSLGNSPSRFSTLHASKRDRFVCASVANHIMPFLDGHAHKQQRRLVARIFQQELKAFMPQFSRLAEEAVSGLDGNFQVIRDLAQPLALRVICRLLGIPEEQRLREWSGSFFHLFTKIPNAATRDLVDEHLGEFREWVAGCFADPKRRGVIAGLAAAVDRGELDELVAHDTVILLFADGLENVDSGIGNALLALSNYPLQWERLLADESLVESTVTEILRFDPPAQYIARTCLEDFEWAGRQFKKDISVILLLASANRDERVFDRADQFDISRSPNPHLSFGQGKHSCLGATMVQLELAAVLRAMMTRAMKFELTGQVGWQRRTGHRWIKEAEFRFIS